MEVRGFDEATKEIGRMIRDLSADGLEEYCKSIKSDAQKQCGLAEEELLLHAIKGESTDKFSLEFTLKDENKWECLKKVIEDNFSKMTIIAQGIFKKFIEDNDKRFKKIES